MEESNIGIFCLTADNLTSPWLLFEAGAIAKTKGAQACTLLLDVKPTDIEPPLSLFQHTMVTKADVFRLVRTINSAVAAQSEKALPERVLEEVFGTFWPRLEAKLEEVASEGPPAPSTRRKERELLEEMLEVVRALERRQVALSRVTLRENEAYVMKNGALRPVEKAWIVKDGSWQPVSLQNPTNLGLGTALGWDMGGGTPRGKGLLDVVGLDDGTDNEEPGQASSEEPNRLPS